MVNVFGPNATNSIVFKVNHASSSVEVSGNIHILEVKHVHKCLQDKGLNELGGLLLGDAKYCPGTKHAAFAVLQTQGVRQ